MVPVPSVDGLAVPAVSPVLTEAFDSASVEAFAFASVPVEAFAFASIPVDASVAPPDVADSPAVPVAPAVLPPVATVAEDPAAAFPVALPVVPTTGVDTEAVVPPPPVDPPPPPPPKLPPPGAAIALLAPRTCPGRARLAPATCCAEAAEERPLPAS